MRKLTTKPSSSASALLRVVALVLVLVVPSPVAAAPATTIEGKRREATRLQSEIDRRGRLLSVATEDYNEAQLRRDQVEGRITRARRDLERAEERWRELKGRLGDRVRFMYMHPGSWAESWFAAAETLNEFARGRVLAGSVLTTDTDLLLETERARAEMASLQQRLEATRAQARGEERRTGANRQQVLSALQAQRSLLGKVEGEIAQLLEAERRRKLEEAARRAAARPSGGTKPARVSRSLPAPKDVGPVRPGASKAIATAAAQIGKPYEWGAAGPGSYDCSGLTMYAWSAAGVSLPHSSRAQYSSLPKVSQDQIQPGDLLFFGSPIHHVGIYEGKGVMIEAPESGETVRRGSIYRRDYAGAARP